MPEFDLPAAIEELAKATGLCSCWYVFDRNEGRSGVERKQPKSDCPKCGGAGRSVLFPSLRVECDSTTILDDMNRSRHFHNGVGWASNCPGWAPEPNVQVACWDILQTIAKRYMSWVLVFSADGWRISQNKPMDYDVWNYIIDDPADTAEEAVIRAALAEVKEVANV